MIAGVTRSVWAAQRAPFHDADDETDFGHIDALEWGEGHVALEGDWGQMDLVAIAVHVTLL